MQKNLIKIYLIYVVVFLFLISSVTPMVFGYNKESSCARDKENNISEVSTLSYGPMDSPWPMKCHDNRHTGISPYSTADNPMIEKWRFRCATIKNDIVIGDDGTLYFGDYHWYLYAVYPNGTLKWEYRTGGAITSSPVIAEDGTIYVGSWDNALHALNPNGTLKWKCNAKGGSIDSSPAIGKDGTIYFGTLSSLGKGNKIHAVNPNGTLKWMYQTGSDVKSSPAIGSDGTIYIGSYDDYLYAMNPNGTLRWRFRTGDFIQGPPSVDRDGTIYIGSFDNYLYALNPNGTQKWKCKIGVGTASNPSIGNDGTIYVGGEKLYAINPNGNIKWNFDLGPEQFVGFSSPAISADGTIYIGTCIGPEGIDGGDIIAVNPDGTEKWRKRIANYYVDSSPCMGEDGTVYIGSTSQWGGYLHAFGSVESNEPPETPTISGETNGQFLEYYWYTITAVDPNNHPISFYIDWGDENEGWVSERASGENCRYEYRWLIPGRHTIRVKAKDVMGAESDWATLEVAMPKNRSQVFFFHLWEQLLQHFPKKISFVQ